MRKLIAEVGEDEAMAKGIDAYVGTFKDRKERLINRAGVKRALICTALEIAGRKLIETDAMGTASISPVKPKSDRDPGGRHSSRVFQPAAAEA